MGGKISGQRVLDTRARRKSSKTRKGGNDMTTEAMLVALALSAAACGDSQPEAQEADDWQARQPEPQPEPEPEPEPSRRRPRSP